MTFSNILFVTPARPRRAARAPRDTSVAVILVLMMSLVFGPVIGLHLFAAFAPEATAATVVSGSADVGAIPPS